LPYFNGPVLVFHGTHDEIIPVAHGRTLASLAVDGRIYEFDGCSHNTVPPNDQWGVYWKEIEAVVKP